LPRCSRSPDTPPEQTLITEADDLEALMSKLRILIPELLEANGALPPDVDELPFSLIALDRAHRPAA